MAKNPQEVVFEGWLTKSPPTKRIWRARWRRRWFLLTHSGELPGQYILTYYTDRNCRKLKGVIDLDHCEQVDLGLKLDERKLKFDHVFDIRTPTRTYYLAADSDSEMRSWVNCICKVCGLKSTNDEEDIKSCPDVEIEEIPESRRETLLNNFNETPPISPVTTNPYIPISECITGKSPIFDPKDFKTLFEYNRKNSFFKSEHVNESYELPQRNYLNIQDPRFYDCPRKLGPPVVMKSTNSMEKNHSPLQSPTDSDSVFNDEDWVHNTSDLNTSRNNRPSDSSADVDIVATQKFTKSNGDNKAVVAPPPRPPKPMHKTPAPCYLNLTPSKTSKETEENEQPKTTKESQKILTDDMYDFPRSHFVESDGTLRKGRNCYNNAVPVNCVEGTIFRYDVSPKPGTSTSTTIFKYDVDEGQDEPSSPAHSHSSSTAVYSNLPSPLYCDGQLMPPPVVNRDLKPKRKLSDSHSISSNPEPPSPRIAPSVDRKLKPPTPLQEAHMRKHFNVEEDQRKVRAGPSPTPPSLGRSHDSLLSPNDNEQIYHFVTSKMQYLDLDLQGTSSSFTSNSTKTVSTKNQEDTVYKEVDFMKTQAFNITRNILEKERQEPVTFSKK